MSSGLCPSHLGHLSSLTTLTLFFFFSSWLHWVFIAACRLSLVAASGGVLFIAVLRLLIVVASLVVEHEL